MAVLFDLQNKKIRNIMNLKFSTGKYHNLNRIFSSKNNCLALVINLNLNIIKKNQYKNSRTVGQLYSLEKYHLKCSISLVFPYESH